MAQERDRNVGFFSTGGRVDRGVYHIKAAADKDGNGIANQGAVLAIDAVNSSGAIQTVYLFVDFVGTTARLRITATTTTADIPTNTNTDGVVVGGQT